MRKFALAMFVIGSALVCTAQQAGKTLVWIDPADEHASYLQAAVQKKHTPVEFTTDKSKADYVASLTEESQKGSAARAVFLGAANSGARSELSLSVSDPKTSAVVFSYTCEKNGEGKGFQSAAECLAKHWSDSIKNEKP